MAIMDGFRLVREISVALVLCGCFALKAAPAAARQAVPLTLDEAIGTAVAQSPAVQRAEAEYLRGRAARTERYSRLLPTLNFSSGLSHLQELRRTVPDPLTGGILNLPDSLVSRQLAYGTVAAMSVNWTLFDGGRRWDEAAGGRNLARAADLAHDAARVRVGAEVTLAFLDALDAQALVEVRRSELEQVRELERTAEARFRVGEVPEIDLLQARLAASESEIALLDAESEARLAHLSLLERMGSTQLREYELVAPAPYETRMSEEELARRALDRSPVLAELRERARAADRESRSLARELLPSVSVGAEWRRSEWGGNREGFTTSPNNATTVYGLSISWSPFQRHGTILAERDRARASRLVAEAELAGARRIVDREVEAGLERLARARVLSERAELNVRLAERQRMQAEERYRLGLATILERITANALWAAALRQEASARHAALRAVAGIELATGVPLRDLRL